jgi:chromosome segregation protein
LVHIKKLEVYGFKSFGFRNTVVSFEKGLVAVTGPNGSGKSNILDAIMFAIGETSPKLLRVEKMQSLFHDSNSSSHRLVRVSLAFDNTDRGIPVDTDTVTLTREMEGQTGESKYLLNGKAVSKATIMELLEVVLAAPNKLNIVQQGMITRISELNSEERRKIIEDIVGLSYFDEKKAEAIKQLDEADRRLEVAFARMGEIRKRIDELEAERNDQLRYDQIGSELKRFKAVQLSNSIRNVRRKLAAGNTVLESNNQKSGQLTAQLEQFRQEIEKLETEKSKFMHELDVANKAKALVEGKLSGVVHDSERTKAMLAEAERRIAEIERRLPSIDSEEQAIAARIKEMSTGAEVQRLAAAQRKIEVEELKSKLDVVNSDLEAINGRIAKYMTFSQRLETRLAKMSSLRGKIELASVSLEEKIKNNRFRLSVNAQSAQSAQKELESAKDVLENNEKELESSREQLQNLAALLTELVENKKSLESELESSVLLHSRAERLATKFEERASIAKDAMNEDLAIAELMKDRETFGIVGLVHDLLKWDANYERAVLAAGSEWMKAFVVNDIRAMILMAGYAKERRLPRLRIIPLDVISRFREESEVPSDDFNVIGRLSDFVYSDSHPNLPSFLFSSTMLTRNSSSAYTLARQGYRAVSVDGELFEPSGGSMSLDFGGKISDLTKAIIFGESVEDLKEMLGRLSKTIESKTQLLRKSAQKIADLESEQMRLQLVIENMESRIAADTAKATSADRRLQELASDSAALDSEFVSLASELARLKRRISLLEPATNALKSRSLSMADQSSSAVLAERSLERSQINKALDSAAFALSQLQSELNGIDSRLELDSRQLASLQEEKQRLSGELEQRRTSIETLRANSQRLEAELRSLRDQEQEVINSTGGAYGVLQEYETKIKSLADTERRVSKEHNVLERESALLRKDIADLTANESRLTNDLVWLGYKDLLEEMDVQTAIRELSTEYEEVKSRINLRADESYVQVMDGYRGMSGRKNQLESERNSIVSFVQQIEKEKKDVFMEAFQRVDSDIRATFDKMTGGEARLEIENPEDIFSSGVMMLVRFPNKTIARESTALSGGEKTIAATVFLLALQSLKPSPFYLMDEVDAHLDAQNTERLSRVLLDRSRDNQIIMVTLKDSTVAKAALIYGVYPRDGASQVVKYRNPEQVPLAQIAAADAKQ